MSNRADAKSLSIAPEASFDAQNTTAGDYVPVKTTLGGLGDFDPLDEFDGLNHAIGRPRATAEEHLRGGAQVGVELVWTPYQAGAVTDGGTVPASKDALDLLLESALGSVKTIPGEGVASVAGAVVTLDTATHAVGDVMLLQQAGQNGGRVQARLVTDADGAEYTLDAAPTGALTGDAISIGHRAYRAGYSVDGPSFSGHLVEDDIVYQMSGGMFLPESIGWQAGGLLTLKGTCRFNQVVYEGDAPAFAPTPPTSGIIIQNPVKASLGVCYFDDAEISGLMSMSVNFNATSRWAPGLDGAYGRVGQENLTHYGTVELVFGQASSAHRAKMLAGGHRLLRVFVDSGAIVGSPARCQGQVFALWVQVMKPAPGNDGGKSTRTVSCKLIDPGLLGTTPTVVPYWQLIRI